MPYELTKSSIVHETGITVGTLSNNGEISHTFFHKMVPKVHLKLVVRSPLGFKHLR